MFGLNFGASLVPYIMSLIWDSGGGPSVLSITVFLSMLIPLPLLYCTKVFRNDRHVYQPLPTAEEQSDLTTDEEGRVIATV